MSDAPESDQPERSRRGRVALRVGVGLAISAGFVGLAYWSLERQGVTWGGIRERLSRAHFEWVAVYIALLFVLHAIRVIRWGILVRGIGPVPWRKIVGVGLVGQMAIGTFPMRLGEAVRPLLIVETGDVTIGQSMATVVIERVIDGVLLGTMFLVTLIFLRDYDLPDAFFIGAVLTTAIFGGLALGLLVASVFRSQAYALIRLLVRPWAPSLAARILALMEGFFGALRVIVRDRKAAFGFLSLTAAVWFITGASLVPLFLAFDVHLPLIASFAVMCVIVIGYMIPAGPAATGTLNWAVVLGLSAFGVDEGATGALSIAIYLLLLGANVLAGIVGLGIAQIRFSQLWRSTRTEPSPSDSAEGSS